jgi:hypothetical protein
MKVTGTAVVALAGITVAAVGLYLLRNKIGAVLEIPAKVFDAVNNAVPPGMSIVDERGVVIANVSGADLKKYNANPINMGGIGSSMPMVLPWYAGFGYSMEDWERDNPFAEPPPEPTKYSNPISDGVNWVGGKVAGDSNWTLGGWIYDITH